MRRATDDVLKRRTILKAAKLSPQGITRASSDIIKQRKIVKARSPTKTPTPDQNAKKTVSPIRDESTSTPTTKPVKEDGDVLKMRAKLFSRVDTTWVKRGNGKLVCRDRSKGRSVRLLCEGDAPLLDFNVKDMLFVSKLIKESDKGRCAYVRFEAELDAEKGKEVFLIQVKPEQLDTLYSALKE